MTIRELTLCARVDGVGLSEETTEAAQAEADRCGETAVVKPMLAVDAFDASVPLTPMDDTSGLV